MTTQRAIPAWAQATSARLMPSERATIEAATLFSAAFVKGGGKRYTETAPTLGAARAIAQRLESAHGAFGRKAVVYAVNARGGVVPVPADWPAEA